MLERTFPPSLTLHPSLTLRTHALQVSVTLIGTYTLLVTINPASKRTLARFGSLFCQQKNTFLSQRNEKKLFSRPCPFQHHRTWDPGQVSKAPGSYFWYSRSQLCAVAGCARKLQNRRRSRRILFTSSMRGILQVLKLPAILFFCAHCNNVNRFAFSATNLSPPCDSAAAKGRDATLFVVLAQP